MTFSTLRAPFSAGSFLPGRLPFENGVVFDKPNDDGASTEDSSDSSETDVKNDAANKAEDTDAADTKSDDDVTSKVAELQKQLDAERKNRESAAKTAERYESELKKLQEKFKDVDPDEYKRLAEEQRRLEQEKRKAEKEAAKKEGDIEKITKMMAEEHEKERMTLQEQLEAERKAREDAVRERDQRIQELALGNAFSGSNFIRDEVALTPAKARRLYGEHFAVEDGVVVAYDKPVSDPDANKMVDSSGKPLSFDESMKRIVEADPDKDVVLRSKMAPGAGSRTTDTRPSEKQPEKTGRERIAAALEGGALRRS